MKSSSHNVAPRPANPLVALENRIEEIFYQDVHALLPPPEPPLLPSGPGPAQIDDLWDLIGRGNLAERQQRHQINLPLPHQTTTLYTITKAPLPSLLLGSPSKTTPCERTPKIRVLRTNPFPTKSTFQRNFITPTSHYTTRSQLLSPPAYKRKPPKSPTGKDCMAQKSSNPGQHKKSKVQKIFIKWTISKPMELSKRF